MPNILHLDYETFSKADLKKVGAYRYANDPSTEILCIGWAVNDFEPCIIEPDLNNPGYWACTNWDMFEDAWHDPATLIYAHNAQFEIAISDAVLSKMGTDLKPPAHNRWRCTAAMARTAALPASLGRLAEALGLAQQKDTRGAALIRKFCIMQKKTGTRIMPADQPEAFRELCEYCRQDVRTERAAHHALSAFELKGQPLATFQLDIAINSRGLPVNLDGLRKAQVLIDQESSIIGIQFYNLTGFQHSQNVELLKWLKERGYEGENLQVKTIEAALENEEDDFEIDVMEGDSLEVKQALTLKSQIGFASIKKIKSMLACAGPHDNRVRGTIIYHGPTTGRWAGALIQPQNFKRPTIDCTDEAYKWICNGIDLEDLRLMFGNPLEVISSCIRHFIHDVSTVSMSWKEPENPAYFIRMSLPMLDADYAAIESRIVCWYAGQEDALQQYRDKVDRYVFMARVIYKKPHGEIDREERFVGKQTVLGCGFGMGPPKFRVTAAKFGHVLETGLEDIAVAAFRKANPKIVASWYNTERAAKMAINNKGHKYAVRGCHPGVVFFCVDTAGMTFLFIRLPSGRKLAYPHPRIEDDRVTFWGKSTTAQWERIHTYGGKLVENIVQGIAADIMAHGACNAESHGYEIATLIHDEALAYYHEYRGETVEDFVNLLVELPSWATGLPVEAEGEIVPYYKK